MEGWSDRSAFTDGWTKLMDDLALDSHCTFVFTMAGYKYFEVSVFNHQTSTEIYFKKLELVVLDDSINDVEGCDLLIAEYMGKLNTCENNVDKGVVGDSVNEYLKLSTFDSIFNDNDDSKFDLYISSLIDTEYANIQVDPKGKAKIFVDEERLSTEGNHRGKAKVLVDDERLIVEEEIKFNVALDKFMVDFKRKSADVVGDKRLSLEVGVEAKVKCNSVMSVTNCSAITCRTRSKVPAANDRMVISTKRLAENISGKQQCKTSRSFTSTSWSWP